MKSQRSMKSHRGVVCFFTIAVLFLIFAPLTVFAESGTGPLNVSITQYPKDVPAGDALLITLRPNEDVLKVTGRCYNEDVRFFTMKSADDKFYAIIGTDVDEKEPVRDLTITIEYAIGVTKKYVFDLKIKRVEYPVESLTVEQKMVEPPKEEDVRIKEEREAVLVVYRNSRTKPHFDSEFIVPLNTQLSSTFGRRRVLNGIKKSPHSGLDFRGTIGTPVHASNNGQVVLARDLYFTGNTVLIDHGVGVFTAYFHLNEIFKNVGDEVQKGEEIGAVGMTGRSTGPHLHFGVKLNGFYVNPLSVIKLSERLFGDNDTLN